MGPILGVVVRTPVIVAALVLVGCATQASLVDIQTDIETVRGQNDRVAQRLTAIEKSLQDRSASGQRGQADLVVRLDQVSSDLQVVQGRLEEQAHARSELAKSGDDLSFRVNQLSGRLDALEARLTGQEQRPSQSTVGPQVGTVPEAGSQSPAQDRVMLPGRTPRSSSLTPVEAYNLAYNDYVKGNYDLAVSGFQGFLQQYPGSILVPHALYWLGESYYQTKQFPQAIEQYERLMAQYPKHEKLPGALLKEGFAYAAVGDKTKARVALRRVVDEFPHANEANLAKEKLAEFR